MRKGQCAVLTACWAQLGIFWLPGSHACAPYRATFRIKLCWLLDLTGEGAQMPGALGMICADSITQLNPKSPELRSVQHVAAVSEGLA